MVVYIQSIWLLIAILSIVHVDSACMQVLDIIWIRVHPVCLPYICMPDSEWELMQVSLISVTYMFCNTERSGGCRISERGGQGKAASAEREPKF